MPLLIKLLVLFSFLLLIGCQEKSSEPAKPVDETPVQEMDAPQVDPPSEPAVSILDQNDEFDQFKEALLTSMWQLYPGYGVYVGYYKHDDQLLIPNGELRAKRRAFLVNELQALRRFDASQLSTANATDWKILEHELQSSIWYIDSFREYEWNPAQYNPAGVFGVILNTDYKAKAERLTTIYQRLENIPPYYEAAKSNLKSMTIPHTELAIQQSQGTLALFSKQIPDALNDEELAVESLPDKAEFDTRLQLAQQATQNYIDWLNAQLEQLQQADPLSVRSFRIGEDLYEQKFHHDIASSFTAKELYEQALAAMAELHTQMIAYTEQLWPKYMEDSALPEDRMLAVKQLIDKLSERHIAREDFVDEIKRQIPVLQAFLDEKQLVDSDPTRPLVVRLTPEYQRGLGGASVNAPGPYDSKANTYYNVSPLDGFTEEQAESYLREYNHWIMQILNIHEAIPGHYTQLVHANKSPSKIKSIFANGAMIEGWAVYAERMMLENGYADNEPEMWLMYSKWNLRVVVNTILDYSVQVLGMDRAAALDLLMNQAFQQQTEAEGKWRRATMSQVQLASYFNGYSEIMALREEMKTKLGEQFDLRTFHNQFLSYGNAPVSVIRKLMLDQPASVSQATDEADEEIDQPGSEAPIDESAEGDE